MQVNRRMKVQRLLSRFMRDDRGAQLLELALVLPVGIALIFGSFEIGRALVYHHNVDTALRSAARYMARLPAGTTVVDQTRARNLVDFGVWSSTAPTGTLAVTAPGTVEPGDLVCGACFTTDGIVRLEMSVTYTFELLNILAIEPAITFEVSHEQPYIGG